MILFSAQSMGQGSSSLDLENTKDSEKKYRILSYLTVESNLQKKSSPDSRGGSAFYLSPSYQLNDKITIGSSLGYLQSFDTEQKSEMSNLKLYSRYSPLKLSDTGSMSLIHSLAGYLPTNEDARKIDSFQGAIQYDPRLIFTLQPFGVPLTFQNRLSLRKNFHEFTLTEKAQPNINESITNEISLEKSILGTPLSLGLVGSVTQAWTYRDTPKSSYSSSQYLSYSMSSKLFIQIGHSNRNSMYKANGATSNVELFDETSSVYSGTLIGVY